MEFFNKKINASNEGDMDKDAMDLYTKVLKSGLGVMKYEIKFHTSNVNTVILLTRVHLEFIKANTIKL